MAQQFARGILLGALQHKFYCLVLGLLKLRFALKMWWTVVASDARLVMQLLMPVYPGQMRYIRKNLYHAVYIIDPALPSELQVGRKLPL
jgi:hypothetical protein